MNYKDLTIIEKYHKMRKDIKKYDVVDFQFDSKESYLSLIVQVTMNGVSVLPIFPFLNEEETPAIVPRRLIPYDIISNYSKQDKSTLLFLINEENPHLKMAIEKVFYDERRSGRKNKKYNL